MCKGKRSVLLAALSSAVLASGTAVAGAAEPEPPPAWAYPVNPADFKPHPDDGKPRSVPGSTASYTVPQTRDPFAAPDWHPGDHPNMPEVVATGRKPDVWACGYCHRADGPGGPENASLAGLPAAYIIQQMADFKSGARTTAVTKRAPPNVMIRTAKAASDAEVAAAAVYFAALKPSARIQVVETERVPVTKVAGWFLADAKSGQTEPLGSRIIEVPEDLEQFENRDARAKFIAYVPVGSVAKGAALAASGADGKTVPCAVCHGPDLKGLGSVPGIAGRSPSYLVRQLYDIKHGARAGLGSAPMLPAVEKLTVDDMLLLAAYAASLKP